MADQESSFRREIRSFAEAELAKTKAESVVHGVPNHIEKLADLFKQRNAVYGDNFLMVGKLMVAMFPDGITLRTEDDHNKFHLFMLKIVKLSRYAINYEEGHEDSLDDDIVYTAMVAALDARAREAGNG